MQNLFSWMMGWRLLALFCMLGVGPLPEIARCEDGYNAIMGPCRLSFPKDHGPHPGYKTEWWYYTGNVAATTGEAFGFQVVFFRSQLAPSHETAAWPAPASAWRSNQIFLAHMALTDIGAATFHHHDRMLRGALGLAGAAQNGSQTTVFIRDWRTRIAPEAHCIKAATKSFAIDLTLTPQKRPVLHGDRGYSLKGRTPERSSCYYSLTRLKTSGEITVGRQQYRVTGTSWMDHEFSSAPLEPGLAGWDWFSLQLSDQTEIMIYLMRQKEGGFSPVSSGTYVDADGASRHLRFSDFSLQTLRTWKSPKSGATYPNSWRLRLPALGLELNIVPNLNDQELRTPGSTNVTYWEGSVSVQGQKAGNLLTGRGYVELTGYAKDFDAPM
jgi:predicted secreted hydrolase